MEEHVKRWSEYTEEEIEAIQIANNCKECNNSSTEVKTKNGRIISCDYIGKHNGRRRPCKVDNCTCFEPKKGK